MNRDFRVFLFESRPMNEGQNAALELVESGINVTIMADAAMSYAVERCDIVLVGADTFSEKSLINKIGTRPLALLAREFVKPIYIVSTLDKFLPSKLLIFEEKQRPKDEVWKDSPKTVGIWNKYFEPTPMSSFTGLITESGFLNADQLVEMAKIKKIDQNVKNYLINNIHF